MKNGENKMTVDMTLSLILVILFATLKLGGVIEWSWLWVFAPLWGIILVMFLFVLLMTTIKVFSPPPAPRVKKQNEQKKK